MKSAFLRFENITTTISLWIASAMLAFAACMGMTQVLMRFVFEEPSEWSEVLIRFALIWMVFMGIPGAFRVGAMVSIDLMHRLAKPGFQRILEFVIALASLTLLGVIAWVGWDYAQRGKVQSMMGLEQISMFWAYIALPIGSVIGMISVIGNFLDPIHRELETAQ